jgi:hypothetical protein
MDAFFTELSEQIAFRKNHPERIYRIKLHPIRGEPYRQMNITSMLFKVTSLHDLWRQMYKYIYNHNQQVADTIFFNEEAFQRCLEHGDITSAVDMYVGWLTQFQDDIWAVEMKL